MPTKKSKNQYTKICKTFCLMYLTPGSGTYNDKVRSYMVAAEIVLDKSSPTYWARWRACGLEAINLMRRPGVRRVIKRYESRVIDVARIADIELLRLIEQNQDKRAKLAAIVHYNTLAGRIKKRIAGLLDDMDGVEIVVRRSGDAPEQLQQSAQPQDIVGAITGKAGDIQDVVVKVVKDAKKSKKRSKKQKNKV